MPRHVARLTRSRAGLLAGVLTLCTAIAAAGAHVAQASSVANFNRETYAYSSTLSTQSEANRYQVIVLQSSDAGMVPLLKAANPHVKILVYEALFAAENVNTSYTTCTTGPADLAQHPTWLLHDQYGRPILNQGHYLMNPGNTAYQQACVATAAATAGRGHFDGVFWDMVNAQLNWTLPSGITVPAYPTPSSWQSATYAMINVSAAELHTDGLLDVANIGGAFLYPGLWQRWTAPLDGSEEESFTSGKTGPVAGVWAWPRQLANAAWSEAHGKLTMLHSWDATRAGNVYGLASMLLVAGGHSSYSLSNACYTSCETWYPEYTTARNLGMPLGPYTRLSNGVYKRSFQDGVVVVNPSTSAVPYFSLGGKRYTGSGLTDVAGLRLAAASGAILQTAG